MVKAKSSKKNKIPEPRRYWRRGDPMGPKLSFGDFVKSLF